MDAIERAVEAHGGQAQLAAALGVTQPTVSEWVTGRRRVPAERCPDIERLCRDRGVEVLCEQLRGDIAWGVLRELAAR